MTSMRLGFIAGLVLVAPPAWGHAPCDDGGLTRVAAPAKVPEVVRVMPPGPRDTHRAGQYAAGAALVLAFSVARAARTLAQKKRRDLP
jgi:hypothetical protein